MKIKIVNLSKGKDRNISNVEATFSKDGVLVPLRVNEDDRPGVFNEINKLLKSKSDDLAGVAKELFILMSPEAKVQEQISSSYYLSGSLAIKGGHIFFGKNRLEETLSNHMMSLLDGENTPKDEKMWRSYVKFLDNLHQNADEDIRNQLFRWMEYENKSGNGFGITDDGCLVGYKGCGGTILEPMSVFTGDAIVDGEEYKGQIPNRAGSVIQMPRSAVQVDPSVGCSQGLHVGTRDYAVKWAPVLLLVKVNPRDVVSVPYECDSQKMRVCEYTVLKVTDAGDEHKMYHESDSSSEEEDYVLSSKKAYDLLGSQISVEYDSIYFAEGTLVDVYGDGEMSIIVRTEAGEVDIELSRIDDYSVDSDDSEDEDENEDFVMTLDEAHDLMDSGEEIVVDYEGKEFAGVVVDVYEAYRKDPGVIMKNDDGEYKHIKLFRIDKWESVEKAADSVEPSEIFTLATEIEENLMKENAEYKTCDTSECNNSQSSIGAVYDEVNDIPLGTMVTVVYAGKKPGKLKAVQGTVVKTCKCEMELEIETVDGENKVIPYTSLHSVQVIA